MALQKTVNTQTYFPLFFFALRRSTGGINLSSGEVIKFESYCQEMLQLIWVNLGKVGGGLYELVSNMS